uniref:MADF domain-containing protein n=1 Tax=Acrobeloides nanus TaxID=290746 RepID=A0A914CC38_9BILA
MATHSQIAATRGTPEYSIIAEPYQWTIKEKLRLIEEIKPRRELWDVTNPGYHSFDTKREKWYEVTSILSNEYRQFTVDEVKNQWKSLRDNHNKQRKKVARMANTAHGQDVTMLWPLWKPMEFLISGNTANMQADRLNNVHVKVQVVEDGSLLQEEEVDLEDGNHLQIAGHETIQSSSPGIIVHDINSINQRKRKVTIEDARSFEHQNLEYEILERLKTLRQRDEHDALGELVAATHRNMKAVSTIHAQRLKSGILKLISEIEDELTQVEVYETEELPQ